MRVEVEVKVEVVFSSRQLARVIVEGCRATS
jgi:hypothetical protein